MRSLDGHRIAWLQPLMKSFADIDTERLPGFGEASVILNGVMTACQSSPAGAASGYAALTRPTAGASGRYSGPQF